MYAAQSDFSLHLKEDLCDVLWYISTCWMGKELCLHMSVQGCIWLAFVYWHLVPWLSRVRQGGWSPVHTLIIKCPLLCLFQVSGCCFLSW